MKRKNRLIQKAALGGAAVITLALMGAGCQSKDPQVKILDPREVVPTPYYDPAPAATPSAVTTTRPDSFGSSAATTMAPPAMKDPAPAPPQEPTFARPEQPSNFQPPVESKPERRTRRTAETHAIQDEPIPTPIVLEAPEPVVVEPKRQTRRAPAAPADQGDFRVAPRGTMIADTPDLGTTELPPMEDVDVTPTRRTDVNPLTYEVQRGDSLWKIAKMYGVSTSELAMANNMDKSDTLSIGRVLTIPAGGSLKDGAATASRTTPMLSAPTPSGTPSTTRVKEAIPASGTYTVQKGDSLWSIGVRYNITTATMQSMNPHLDSVLQPGDTVYLTPQASASAPVSTSAGSSGGYTPRALPEDNTAAPSPERFDTPAQKQQEERWTIIGKTPTGAGTPSSANRPASHTVQRGDSLWSIGKKYGIGVAELKSMNNLSSDRLDIGDVIVLKPGGGGAAPAPQVREVPSTPAPRPETQTAPTGGGTATAEVTSVDPSRMIRLPHFVDPGDTLEEIADMYNSKVEWIKDANPQLKSGGRLQDQKQIMVPVQDDTGL